LTSSPPRVRRIRFCKALLGSAVDRDVYANELTGPRVFRIETLIKEDSMKIAITLAAVAASGIFAAGDRPFPAPSQMPAPAKVSEFDFSTPPLAGVVPFDLPTPIESRDQTNPVGACGCGGASAADRPKSDEAWEIEGCATGIDDEEIDIPSGATDHVR
jgi:hypothetical protein